MTRRCHQTHIGPPRFHRFAFRRRGRLPAQAAAQAIADRNERLRQAVRRNPAFSAAGLLETLFATAFKGLVYAESGKTPSRHEALAITPDCNVVAIASGGCNILSYLIANPMSITAVDLKLRRTWRSIGSNVRRRCHLPTWEAFYRFCGSADDIANLEAYRRHLAPHLDRDTRAYWEQRGAFGFGRRRISMFARNIYRHGLLGHFIGLSHARRASLWVEPSDFLRAQTLDEQRRFFDTSLAPIFEKRFVRWATGRQLPFTGSAYRRRNSTFRPSAGNMANVLRGRVERLTCGFSVHENYFAWQAFGRAMQSPGGPLPPYLRRENFEAISTRAGHVKILNRSFTEYL